MEKYISADDIRYQLANLKQLTFEVTDACNLRCKYCAYGEFYNDYDRRENKTLSLSADSLNRLSERLLELGMEYVAKPECIYQFLWR